MYAQTEATTQTETPPKKKQLQPRRETLKQLGGVCARTTERWEQKPELGFPPPVFINGRKYDDPEEIVAFIAARKAARR
jgi:hypothetical protein